MVRGNIQRELYLFNCFFSLYLGTGRIVRWLPNAIRGDTAVGGLTGTPEYVNSQQAVFDENNNMLVLETYSNRIRLYNIVTC